MSDIDQNDIPKAESDAGDEDLENLSQTEKAAFEKIISEINSAETKSDALPNPGTSMDVPVAPEPAKEQASSDADIDNIDSEAGTDDDNLSDDQQAALDQMMAEIEGSGSEDPAPAAQEVPDAEEKKSAPEDELDPDQQAALDQIMAEIKGGGSEDPPSGAGPSADTQNSDAGAEPQAEPLKPVPPPSPDPLDKKQAPDGLSMDEFDDQLNSLLSNVNDGELAPEITASDPSPKTPSPPVVEKSLKDINSALKNIVNEAQDEADETVDPEDDASNAPLAESAFVELQEIETDKDTKTTSTKLIASGRLKKILVVTAISCTCLLLAVTGYLGYGHFFKSDRSNPNAPSSATTTVPVIPMDSQKIPESTQTVAQTEPIPQATTPSVAPTAKPRLFGDLRADIATARQKLEARKTEILDLKRYYQNGIQEERAWLRSKQRTKLPTFKAALKNHKTELGLQSIQRRMIYNSKLEAPLLQLESYSEQLLYLERRVQLYELLSDAISGLTFTEIKREGAELIQNIFRESDQLSIEKIEVAAPSLESIWKGLQDRTVKATSPATSGTLLSASDLQISKSICDGRYERKYLLTTLTPQTAECLAKWPGMDLYLNELTHLPPEAAKQISQWSGEWLSLNGIKSLSADSAKYLSQWTGKRLSLNGVTVLSPEATAYLAKWQGEQLEMIGLTSIGRWENYVTQLFLSESLRRKLHIQ